MKRGMCGTPVVITMKGELKGPGLNLSLRTLLKLFQRADVVVIKTGLGTVQISVEPGLREDICRMNLC